MKNFKFQLLFSLILISFFVLTACNSSGAEEPSDNSGDENTVSISIGTARDPQLASEMIIADEEGFFSEEGLDVDLQLFQSGADLTAALAGQSIVMGSAGDAPSTILKASGSNVQMIAQQSDISGAQSMIVNPDVISVPSDLNGKKVAFSPGNTSEALFLRIVEEYSLDEDSMEIFKMGPTEMLAAFEQGDVDAYVVWEPTVLNGVKAGGERLVSASYSYVPGEEGEQKILGAHSLLIADTEFLDNDPETVKAILRALAKAVAFIESDPDKAAEDVANALELETEDVTTMMELNKYSLAITPELIEDIQSTADFLKQNEKIEEVLDYSEFVNTSFLEEVDPDLVTWTP